MTETPKRFQGPPGSTFSIWTLFRGMHLAVDAVVVCYQVLFQHLLEPSLGRGTGDVHGSRRGEIFHVSEALGQLLVALQYAVETGHLRAFPFRSGQDGGEGEAVFQQHLDQFDGDVEILVAAGDILHVPAGFPLAQGGEHHGDAHRQQSVTSHNGLVAFSVLQRDIPHHVTEQLVVDLPLFAGEMDGGGGVEQEMVGLKHIICQILKEFVAVDPFVVRIGSR